jgi:hypothetical protein
VGEYYTPSGNLCDYSTRACAAAPNAAKRRIANADIAFGGKTDEKYEFVSCYSQAVMTVSWESLVQYICPLSKNVEDYWTLVERNLVRGLEDAGAIALASKETVNYHIPCDIPGLMPHEMAQTIIALYGKSVGTNVRIMVHTYGAASAYLDTFMTVLSACCLPNIITSEEFYAATPVS